MHTETNNCSWSSKSATLQIKYIPADCLYNLTVWEIESFYSLCQWKQMIPWNTDRHRLCLNTSMSFKLQDRLKWTLTLLVIDMPLFHIATDRTERTQLTLYRPGHTLSGRELSHLVVLKTVSSSIYNLKRAPKDLNYRCPPASWFNWWWIIRNSEIALTPKNITGKTISQHVYLRFPGCKPSYIIFLFKTFMGKTFTKHQKLQIFLG